MRSSPFAEAILTHRSTQQLLGTQSGECEGRGRRDVDLGVRDLRSACIDPGLNLSPQDHDFRGGALSVSPEREADE